MSCTRGHTSTSLSDASVHVRRAKPNGSDADTARGPMLNRPRRVVGRREAALSGSPGGGGGSTDLGGRGAAAEAAGEGGSGRGRAGGVSGRGGAPPAPP